MPRFFSMDRPNRILPGPQPYAARCAGEGHVAEEDQSLALDWPQGA
jgi:hypothetical protein